MKKKSQYIDGYKMTIKTRKEAANKAFSEYIRRSHADEFGNVTCYTCGAKIPWKEADAGHGINGRRNFVLFLEDVVKPQCTYCNRNLDGNYPVFIPKLIDEIGREIYDNYVIMNKQTLKIYPYEYLDIQKRYEAKIEELEVRI